MSQIKEHLSTFDLLARQNCSLSWYAIADAAQHCALPEVIALSSGKTKCFFDAEPGSPLARSSPHLMELPPPSHKSPIWHWIVRNAKKKPCMTVIASNIGFSRIFESLTQAMEVTFEDGYRMIMAFWDPVVLGSLMGQTDDRTLHVKGPVLDADQRRRLGSFISYWLYWGRNEDLHSISIESGGNGCHEIVLRQSQIDMLVEASLPDYILFQIEKNQSLFMQHDTPFDRYQRVRAALPGARELGLTSVVDLVNYVCLDIHYGKRLKCDPEIVDLLEKVKAKEMKFCEAAHNFP